MITATYSNTAPNDRSAVKPATFAAFLVLALTLPLRAGTITGVIHVIGGELSPGGIELFPDEVNNDGDNSGRGDPEFSGNFGTYELRFSSLRPVDLALDVAGSSGTSEYDFIIDLANGTGADWTGLRLELGSGTGDDFVATSLAGLDFDTPDGNSAVELASFPPSEHNATSLVWSDVQVLAGNLASASFSIDVPDDAGPYQFTLRHVPIPEPAAVVTFAFVGIAVVASRRNRRRP